MSGFTCDGVFDCVFFASNFNTLWGNEWFVSINRDGETKVKAILMTATGEPDVLQRVLQDAP
ncbi:MAG: hypothetical protein ABFS24_13300 [Pseudomonadota bacterium]